MDRWQSTFCIALVTPSTVWISKVNKDCLVSDTHSKAIIDNRSMTIPHTQVNTMSDAELKSMYNITDEIFKAIVVLVPRNYDISNRAAEKSSLVQQNKTVIPGLQINDIWWLDHGRARAGSILREMVIEFSTAAFAEAAIRERFMVLGASWRCYYLDSRLDLQQCSCCWQYGHIMSVCEHLHSGKICRYCARSHDLERCHYRDCPKIWICAVCRGTHEATNERCPARKQQRKAAIDRLRAKQEVIPTKPVCDKVAGARVEKVGPPKERKLTRFVTPPPKSATQSPIMMNIATHQRFTNLAYRHEKMVNPTMTSSLLKNRTRRRNRTDIPTADSPLSTGPTGLTLGNRPYRGQSHFKADQVMRD